MPAVEVRQPRPPIPGPIGRLFSLAYGAAIARRNRRFDARRGVVQFDRPVISVGNLSVGGTGKTPMVRHIVRTLQEAGHRPAIAMRGYGARGGEQSDEAMEYAAALPGVPVVARVNRTLGLIQMFATPEGEAVDVIVLDDGFQHRQIARQLDILLIDATRDPFRDALLPAGLLREPVAAIGRAGFAVITHTECAAPESIGALRAGITRKNGHIPVALARHVWSGLTITRADSEQVVDPSWLGGQRPVAVCAIGNPGPFLAECRRRTGRSLAAEVVLPDHDPYSPATVRRISAAARDTMATAILTTEKDWAKLKSLPPSAWPCPVVRTRLEVQLDKGGEQLSDAVLKAAQLVPE